MVKNLKQHIIDQQLRPLMIRVSFSRAGHEIAAEKLCKDLGGDINEQIFLCGKEKLENTLHLLKLAAKNKNLALIFVLPSVYSVIRYNFLLKKLKRNIYIYTPFLGSEWNGVFVALLKALVFKIFLFSNFTKIREYHYISPYPSLYRKVVVMGLHSYLHLNRCDKSKIIKNSNRGSSEKFELLIIGRFDFKQKGQDWMLSTYEQSTNKVRDKFDLIFIGDGEGRAYITKFAELSKGRIVVSPWLDSQITVSEKSILVIPSEFEGYPLVAIEAILAGVVVMASSRSNLDELLGERYIFEKSEGIRYFEEILDNIASDYEFSATDQLIRLKNYEAKYG